MGTQIDISDKKKTERELEIEKIKAVEETTAKSEFLSKK
jgi:hypothetical protein